MDLCSLINSRTHLTNNDKLCWKTDCRPPANGPPTTTPQQRQHRTSTQARGQSRPHTSSPSPQRPPPTSQREFPKIRQSDSYPGPRSLLSERECCLLVLHSVTSTQQWIRQEKQRGCVFGACVLSRSRASQPPKGSEREKSQAIFGTGSMCGLMCVVKVGDRMCVNRIVVMHKLLF
jgi:hypothetical protein